MKKSVPISPHAKRHPKLRFTSAAVVNTLKKGNKVTLSSRSVTDSGETESVTLTKPE